MSNRCDKCLDLFHHCACVDGPTLNGMLVDNKGNPIAPVPKKEYNAMTERDWLMTVGIGSKPSK